MASKQIQHAGKPSTAARFKTSRGLRRLSFREAYLNRTTDSSRARVEKLYGRTAGPALRAQAFVQHPKPRPMGPRIHVDPRRDYSTQEFMQHEKEITERINSGEPLPRKQPQGRPPKRRRRRRHGTGNGGVKAPY